MIDDSARSKQCSTKPSVKVGRYDANMVWWNCHCHNQNGMAVEKKHNMQAALSARACQLLAPHPIIYYCGVGPQIVLNTSPYDACGLLRSLCWRFS